MIFIPRGWVVKNSPASARRHKRHRFASHIGKTPWRRKWQPAPVFVPGESYGRRNLAGCSPWGRKELDMTAQLSTQRTRPYLSRSTHTPRSSAGKESACNAGDPGSIPGWGSSPGEGNGYPLQYSGLENPMDRGAQSATVHGVTNCQTRLSD